MNKNLNEIISNNTISILNRYGITDIDSFFKICELKEQWGNISRDINTNDRIKLERLLLENKTIDNYAYYPARTSPVKDYLIKYELILKGNVACKIMGQHIIYECVTVDRLKRQININLTNDANDSYKAKIDITYWQSERFFSKLECCEMKNSYAFEENIFIKTVQLNHVSGKEDVYTGVIENEYDINIFLSEFGINLDKLSSSLINPKQVNR